MKYLWRLSILLAPWQIRWFHEGSMIGSVPFEASRISVYLSSFLMLALIIATFRQVRPTIRWDALLPAFVIAYLFILSSTDPRISLLWLLQVSLIAAWIWSLSALKISLKDLLTWFVLSLIPHAVLAIGQFATQFVFGSKWLGIATQNPLTPGVSVVMQEGRRVLRAYGGFPHPNILGGWMAVGSVAAICLTVSEKNKKIWFWFATGSVCLTALVFSFSRSAWLMFVVGLIALAFQWKKIGIWSAHKKILIGFMSVFVILLAMTSPVWWSRVQVSDRLEQLSIDERESTIKTSVDAIKQSPFFGNGLATSPLAMHSTVAPLYPHNLILIILVETGLAGLSLIAYLAWQLRRYIKSYVWLIVLIPGALVDHYLWSFWPGLVLFGLVILFSTLTSDPIFRQSVDKV